MAGSLIMYVVLGVSATLGSLIAWDDLRSGKRDHSRTKQASADGNVS